MNWLTKRLKNLFNEEVPYEVRFMAGAFLFYGVAQGVVGVLLLLKGTGLM
jgi:hypothetical protein